MANGEQTMNSTVSNHRVHRMHDTRAGDISNRASEISLSTLAAMCRRHLWFFVIWVVIWTAVAGLIVFNLKPAYQATAELVIDSRLSRPSEFLSVVSGPFTLQDYVPVVRSEVHILQSPYLASRVIDQLNLTEAPEFQSEGLRARLENWLVEAVAPHLPQSIAESIFPLTKKLDADARRNLLVEKYLRRLTVSNDGRSLSVTVAFWASDPRLAAEIVNAHVRLYLADQRSLKEDTSSEASKRIGQQVELLAADLHQREDTLSRFREQAGLVNAQGATVVAQQVAQATAELSRARAEAAQREALVDRIRSGGDSDIDAQSSVINSLLIQHLRQQEAEFSANLARLQASYSSESRVTRLAAAQLSDVRQKIRQETDRIISSIKTDARIARAHANNFAARLEALQGSLRTQDRSDMRMGEMERDIAAKRGVYRDLMSRQQQISAQVGTEAADARIVAPASVPPLPFYPQKLLFITLGFVAACTSGVGAVRAVDLRNTGIKQLTQVQVREGIQVLHSIPLVRLGQTQGHSLPDYLFERPMSEFADSIRSLRTDIVHSSTWPPPCIVAVTSTLPREGKTSVALSVARSMAAAGLRVLLVDCDLRRSRCAEMIGKSPSKNGLISVLTKGGSLAEAVIRDQRSSLELLVPEEVATIPQDLIGRSEFKNVLEEARRSYDFVILDTPPLAVASEAWLIARIADAVVLAVRWQQTSAESVADTIAGFQTRGLGLRGVFLNAVDVAEYARHNGQRDVYKAIRSYYGPDA
jgi:succinoglycan biosynthesis transport protein ExoP